MKDKSLNRNGIRLAQAATGISPADFPLGSLESRASVRALLDYANRMKPRLSEYEEDALTIYRNTSRVLGGLETSPSRSDVEETVVYQHGRELANKHSDKDEVSEGNNANCFTHEECAARIAELLAKCGVELPPKDAKWRDAALFYAGHSAVLAWFQQAWERQLSHLEFPIKTKIEGDDVRLYLRQATGKWKEETNESKRRGIVGPADELKELMQQEQINA